MYSVVLSLPVTDFTDVFFNTENYVKSKPAPDSVWSKAICVCHFWSKMLLSPCPGLAVQNTYPASELLRLLELRDAPADSYLVPWTLTGPSPQSNSKIAGTVFWIGMVDRTFQGKQSHSGRISLCVCRGLKKSELCLLHTNLGSRRGKGSGDSVLLGHPFGWFLTPSFPDISPQGRIPQGKKAREQLGQAVGGAGFGWVEIA